MKKITMLLFLSFFIFSCGNSNTEQKQVEQNIEEQQEEQEVEQIDIVTNVINEYAEQIDNIIKTKDFSEIDELIENNPTNYKYVIVRALANEKLGRPTSANYDYDLVLNNSDLSEVDFSAIKEHKDQNSDIIIKNSIDNIKKIIETKDFSEIDKLIEENPSKYGYRLGRAVAKRILGDVKGSNEDYDFVLNNFELSQDEINLIKEQRNSKEDVILKTAPED